MENNENNVIDQSSSSSMNTPQQSLPNAGGILAMGIISIALCCTSIIGLALGIIALILGNKATKLYKDNPGAYTESSYKNVNAGRICAIIGLCLSGLYLIYTIFILSIYGLAGMAMFNMLGKGM